MQKPPPKSVHNAQNIRAIAQNIRAIAQNIRTKKQTMVGYPPKKRKQYDWLFAHNAQPTISYSA